MDLVSKGDMDGSRRGSASVVLVAQGLYFHWFSRRDVPGLRWAHFSLCIWSCLLESVWQDMLVTTKEKKMKKQTSPCEKQQVMFGWKSLYMPLPCSTMQREAPTHAFLCFSFHLSSFHMTRGLSHQDRMFVLKMILRWLHNFKPEKDKWGTKIRL